jgi:hypothetical protein
MAAASIVVGTFGARRSGSCFVAMFVSIVHQIGERAS